MCFVFRIMCLFMVKWMVCLHGDVLLVTRKKFDAVGSARGDFVGFLGLGWVAVILFCDSMHSEV